MSSVFFCWNGREKLRGRGKGDGDEGCESYGVIHPRDASLLGGPSIRSLRSGVDVLTAGLDW